MGVSVRQLERYNSAERNQCIEQFIMVERIIERIVFYSRWLLAPMFVGLALGLVFLLVSFVSELVHFVSTDGMFHSKQTVPVSYTHLRAHET